jgi:hypothetical protein
MWPMTSLCEPARAKPMTKGRRTMLIGLAVFAGTVLGQAATLVVTNLADNLQHGIGMWLGSQSNLVAFNKIAHNQLHGVLITGSTTRNNSIRTNSIYANGNLGIALETSGNAVMPPPGILSPASNSISGIARPSSVIEFFSDDGDEGRVFEGSTVADVSGQFTLTKPDGFVGPFVTTTATDTNGTPRPFPTMPCLAAPIM